MSTSQLDNHASFAVSTPSNRLNTVFQYADQESKENTVENDVEFAEETYRLYRMRWWGLLLFSASTFTNAMLWITFASILPLAKGEYPSNLQSALI